MDTGRVLGGLLQQMVSTCANTRKRSGQGPGPVNGAHHCEGSRMGKVGDDTGNFRDCSQAAQDKTEGVVIVVIVGGKVDADSSRELS